MALKLSVKIGDVTNLSDARYAAGMGVDYIGFNIDSSSINRVTPKTFKEIINWVSGVGIIGEIGNQVPENQEEYPSYLTETTNLTINGVSKEAIFRIDAKNLSTTAIKEAIKKQNKVAFFVVELTTEQIEINISFLSELCTNSPIYLSADFNEQLLEKVVNTVKPKGIEIKGGLEDQPGFKDYDGIADVLEWLEEED